MDLEDLTQTLDSLEARLGRTLNDDEDFDEELVAVPRMTLAAYVALLERRAHTPYGEILSELRDLMPGLLDHYRRVGPEERNAILAAIANHRAVGLGLWTLLAEQRWRLQKAPLAAKAGELRDLLLLAVLGETYLDRVETATLLTSAWGDADDAGLDPAQFFREAAAVAGQRPLDHGASANDILREFEPYDYGRS